jgi:hypothetical protein
MWDMIFAGIGMASFVGSYVNFVRVRGNLADVQKVAEKFQESNLLYEWAKDAVVVVRNRDDHTDVMRTTVLALYGRHREGMEFRDATMLFQTGGFKVYAQSKPKAE